MKSMKRNRTSLSFRRPRKKPLGALLKIILVIVIFILVSCLVLRKITIFAKKIITTTTTTSTTTTTTIDPEVIALQQRKTKLVEDMNSILTKYSDTEISVSFKDSDFEEIQSYGNTEPYTAASTTKVLTAVYYLHMVESGDRTLEQAMGNYTAKFQIQQMINQSNNNSWHLLNTNLGYPNLQIYAHSIGLSSYLWNGNTISSADENLLIQKLYNGELINEEHRQLLFSYMQNTNYETLIPAALPESVTVYHKYGILDYNLHDNAILLYKNKPIFLTIMTTSATTMNISERNEIFHEIVNAILKFERIE